MNNILPHLSPRDIKVVIAMEMFHTLKACTSVRLRSGEIVTPDKIVMRACYPAPFPKFIPATHDSWPRSKTRGIPTTCTLN
jgi:hypothetical protein